MQNERAKLRRHEIGCSASFADDVDYFCYEEYVALPTTAVRPFRRNNWRLPEQFVNFRIRALFLLIQLLKCEKFHMPFFPQASTAAAHGRR
jgi:hypothetical protein